VKRTATGACAAAVALAIGGCDPEEVTLPEPPMAAETQQLVALYDMPTAMLNVDNIEAAGADARARLQELHPDWFPGVVTDLLTRLRARLDDGNLPSDPASEPKERRAQITAVANLHRICAGWDDPASAPDEASNGAIDLTAIVDTGRLNPQAWATATACRARFPPAGGGGGAIVVTPTAVNATLDGTLIIYLLAPLPATAADAQLLVVFNGSITIGAQTKSASFDFEIDGTSLKFRVPAGGGDAIVTVGTTLGIQGANASFSCGLTTLSCQSST
jgi:hypothetical protein